MGNQIIKQPDGRLAVFSSNVDDWIMVDASPDEVMTLFLAWSADDVRRNVGQKLEDVLQGNARASYYQFTMTYEEACAWIKESNLNPSEEEETAP